MDIRKRVASQWVATRFLKYKYVMYRDIVELPQGSTYLVLKV
ncbi:hypothetical protein [Anaerocolumna aminovalerica]|nr:hypothetical protein [Anaerocolumna aminovalerica]